MNESGAPKATAYERPKIETLGRFADLTASKHGHSMDIFNGSEDMNWGNGKGPGS